MSICRDCFRTWAARRLLGLLVAGSIYSSVYPWYYLRFVVWRDGIGALRFNPMMDMTRMLGFTDTAIGGRMLPSVATAFFAILLVFGIQSAWAGPVGTPPDSPAIKSEGVDTHTQNEVGSPGTWMPDGPAKVAYVPIEGVIDSGKATYFKRVLESAKEQKVTHLVVHLTTPGGHLSAGMEMLSAALDTPRNGPRLIAFVDDHSLSAGSLIGYGHDEIYVTNKAMLGDIGVITQGSDGKIEYLPEKIETVVRALLRNAAQNRGWDQAKLVKMTARNQELYRFDVPDGHGGMVSKFVIEDDLGKFLSDHPRLKEGDKTLVLGKDRLLSYTGREAVAEGMATAMVDDLEAIYTRLGVTKDQVLDLSPTSTERTAWALASFAPLLAAAAMLFLFLEFKMPSGGLWIGLAVVCGIAFFACQFYMDLATYLEVILILSGLILVLVELFIFPLGGLIALLGGLFIAVGLVLSFVSTGIQFQPYAVGYGDALMFAVLQSGFALSILSVGTLFFIMALPKLALRTGLADAAAITAISSDGANTPESQAGKLIGRVGFAHTMLRPSGQISIDGQLHAGMTDNGSFLPPGAEVNVIAIHFGELVVRSIGSGSPSPQTPSASSSGSLPQDGIS